MANVLREPTFAPQPGRRPFAPDIPPNLLLATLLPVVLIKPFFQAEWPVPFRARPLSYDFQHSGVLTRGIPSPPPFSQRDFATPMRVRATPVDYTQAGYPAPSAGFPVGVSGVWPEIMRSADRDYLALDRTVYLPGPVAAPFIPADLPTPMRARMVPQDFSFRSTGIPPAAPFKQSDWPLFLSRRYAHQDFFLAGTTTRGIPFGLLVPFSQTEWPIYPRPKLAYADSYASPRILLSTPVLRPFAQQEWITPRTARLTPLDWQVGGHTTRGIPPVPTFAATPITVRAFALGYFAEQYRNIGDTFVITLPQQYSPYWMTFVDTPPDAWLPFLATLDPYTDREVLEFGRPLQ